jgi:hypothetical protein
MTKRTIRILMDIMLAEISRGLGFLRFRTIDYARDFLERSHPCIYLYGPTAGENDRSTKVRIAYSREREDRTRSKGEGDWTCRMVGVLPKHFGILTPANYELTVCGCQFLYTCKVLSLQCTPSRLVYPVSVPSVLDANRHQSWVQSVLPGSLPRK